MTDKTQNIDPKKIMARLAAMLHKPHVPVKKKAKRKLSVKKNAE